MVRLAGRTDRTRGKAETRRARRCGAKPGPCWVGLAAALALLHSSAALAAENRVILLRGWLSIFSNGLDQLANELRAKGFNAEVRDHLYWTNVVNDILRDRAEGKIGTLIFVGHSQGGNDAIEIAYALQLNHIPVDLIVTLAPYYPKPVPANVTRAVDYYQQGGWGSPLTPGAGFRGTLANFDLADDATIYHFNIDKSPKIRAELLREIEAVPQANAVSQKMKPPGRKAPSPAIR
jgi:hypothetical protein